MRSVAEVEVEFTGRGISFQSELELLSG